MTFSCARIQHCIRINNTNDEQVGFCCALKGKIPNFFSVDEMYASNWYAGFVQKQEQGIWPDECEQCSDQEKYNQLSFRQTSNKKHQVYKKLNPNYKVFDISTDNICNAACQTCGPGSSSLYAKIMNYSPMLQNKGIQYIERYLDDNVIQVDLAGGEPFYSKSYRKILANLPDSVKWLRINTNGSMPYDLSDLLNRGIVIELTVSIDAIGNLFEYIRWPLKWDVVEENLLFWIKQRDENSKLKLALNPTISALNIEHIEKIRDYAKKLNLAISYNHLNRVDVLDIRYRNKLTERAINVQYDFPIAVDRDNSIELEEWLKHNDQARGIDHRTYYGE